MKRCLIGLLAALMLFSLAACGGKENAPPPQEPDQSSGGSNLPNTPETPETPDTPNVPNTPDTPETPETPDIPEVPETPVVPEPPEDQQPETAVRASHTDVTFRAAGDNFRLRPRGMEGTYTARFASEDESIAVVDENGRVTAVAPGTTHVTMHVEQAGETYDFRCIIRCIWEAEPPEEEPGEPETPTDPETPEEETPSDGKVDLAAFYETITGQYEFGHLQNFEGDILANYYPGMEAISTNQRLVMGTMMTFNNGEFCLVEVTDSADVETVKGIFQTRIQYMVDGGAWYPGPTEQWTNNSRVVSNGNYIMMIVHENCDDIVDAFQALF